LPRGVWRDGDVVTTANLAAEIARGRLAVRSTPERLASYRATCLRPLMLNDLVAISKGPAAGRGLRPLA
jgi:hypothetical protein